MNPGFKFAAWMGGASLICFGLAAIEMSTGLVSRIAPTETHAMAWLCIAALLVFTVRLVRRVRMPAFGLKWPTPKYSRQRRYAQRQRRIVL